MDLEFLNDVKVNSHLFTDILASQCPKCDLFSFVDRKCSSCHYDGNISTLGEPLGDKSFYSVKENFYFSLTKLEKDHPSLFKEDSRFKLYLNKIKLRYNDLLDYFYSEQSIECANRNLYLHEIRDIVIEMMRMGESEETIYEVMNKKNGDDSSLFSRIREVVASYNQEKASYSKPSLEYKFGGVVTIGSLILYLMITLVLVSLSFSFITYSRIN